MTQIYITKRSVPNNSAINLNISFTGYRKAQIVGLCILPVQQHLTNMKRITLLFVAVTAFAIISWQSFESVKIKQPKYKMWLKCVKAVPDNHHVNMLMEEANAKYTELQRKAYAIEPAITTYTDDDGHGNLVTCAQIGYWE